MIYIKFKLECSEKPILEFGNLLEEMALLTSPAFFIILAMLLPIY